MFEYRYNATDGELLRFDRKKGVYEAYNWREKKWHNSANAYDAYVGIYDGFLHKITEANAEQIIREKVPGKRFDMDRLK